MGKMRNSPIGQWLPPGSKKGQQDSNERSQENPSSDVTGDISPAEHSSTTSAGTNHLKKPDGAGGVRRRSRLDQVKTLVKCRKRPLVLLDFDGTITVRDFGDLLEATHGIPEELLEHRNKDNYLEYLELLVQNRCKALNMASASLLLEQPVDWRPGMKELLQKLSRKEAEVQVLSDTNTATIRASLKRHGCEGCVDKVLSNEAVVGRDVDCEVRFRPFHEQTECAECPKNLCKGLVVRDLLSGRTDREPVAYVGDGNNDYCPILHLRSVDMAYVLHDSELYHRVRGSGFHPEYKGVACRGNKDAKPPEIKASVIYWKTGHDILKSLIKRL